MTESPPTDRLDCDVLIVGGGLVGSTLAVALADASLDVVLVESSDPTQLEQPSFDARVTALANGSKRILDTLGIWAGVGVHAEPIAAIHVSERGRFGATRIRAAEEGVRALGYTLENRRLGEALWSRLAHVNACRVLGLASLRSFAQNDDGVVRAEVESAGERLEVCAKLLVAADGAHSRVRTQLRISTREDHYAQQALILNCRTDRPHGGVAYERFLPDGPLAMLPLPAGRVGVVWTLPAERANEAAAWTDAELCAALHHAFGHRLGRIVQVGRRVLHPLRRVRSDALGAGRVVLVGNAAVTLHPVAGQGFNLALRDVAALAELIADAAERNDYDTLAERYSAWRASDQRKVALFTHGLVGLFGARLPGMGAARGLALAAFDALPGAKAALAQHTMGIAGRLPRLARGLPLSAASRER
jgi:2-octaprenyl-6-methoxyphenol hydroxylase